MKLNLISFKKYNKAFSLIELMTAITVMGLVSVGLISVYIYSLKTANTSTANLKIAQGMRVASSQVLSDAQSASCFFIYRNIDIQGTTRIPLDQGQVGNYLVFHFENIDGEIYKTIGYYLYETQPTVFALKKHSNYWSTPYADVESVPLPKIGNSTDITLVDSIQGSYIDGNQDYVFLLEEGDRIIFKGKVVIKNPSGSSKSGVQEISRNFSFIITPLGAN